MNNIGVDRVSTDNNYDFKYKFNDSTDNNNINIYHEVGHTCKYIELEEFQKKVSDIKNKYLFFLLI